MSTMSEITLDFLCHADFSGRLRKTSKDAGFSAFSASVEAQRRQNPEGTLFLDAGDSFSTSFWGGLPIVAALNLLKTDVMTLGNHEFDRGQAFVEDCIAACDFPVLCANVRLKAEHSPIAGTSPYAMFERKGVKIGVLGLTTEYTPYMVEKKAFEPFEMTSAARAAKRYIPQMRSEGAEIIVLLMHAPFYYDEDKNITGELWELLQEIPPVDICIGGHIPGDYANVIDNTCILKAGFGGWSLGHARLRFDTAARRVTEKFCEVLHTDPNAEGPPDIAAYVNGVTEPFEEYFNYPLSEAVEQWEMRLATESKLGDFLADCLRHGGGTELAYMNTTSSGGRIEPGVVTRETITQVCGFNDPVMTGRITGRQLHALIESVYEPERFGNNAALAFSGFHAEIDHRRPSPNKLLGLTLPDGRPIDPERSYTVSTSEYMASGGNDTLHIACQIDWQETRLRFFDAAFAYAETLPLLHLDDWPRLQEQGRPENDNSPF